MEGMRLLVMSLHGVPNDKMVVCAQFKSPQSLVVSSDNVPPMAKDKASFWQFIGR